MSDLTICQNCQVNPAVYGDGLTWSRCAPCQAKKVKENVVSEPTDQPPVEEARESFEHKIIPGLVSIVLPTFLTSTTTTSTSTSTSTSSSTSTSTSTTTTI